MEFQEHDEQEDDIEIPVSPPAYDSLPNNSVPRSKISVSGAAAGEGAAASTVAPGRKAEPAVTARYRECQKNHAVSLGAHAVDGCGEFIAAGEEGTLDGLKCAACNCHRNFHRKETDGGDMTPYQPPPPHYQYHQQYPPYYRAPPPPAGYLHHHLTAQPMALQRSLALPAPAPIRDEEDMSNPSSSGGGGSGGGGGGKKRHRTKFTQEQKDKMLAFAESVGWRIQKHDEAAVEQFCAENCVKRHVLRVWMHNNKNTLEISDPRVIAILCSFRHNSRLFICTRC